jgi:hypothetical protein
VEDEAGKEEEQGLEHGAVRGGVLGLMGAVWIESMFWVVLF